MVTMPARRPRQGWPAADPGLRARDTACPTERRAGRIRLFEQVQVLDRPLRRDALPEHTRYADTGCDLHSSCLTCPFERCRYDEPRGVRSMVLPGREDRDSSVLRVRREEALTVEQVARRFGVSRRTVFRILARARAGEVQAC